MTKPQDDAQKLRGSLQHLEQATVALVGGAFGMLEAEQQSAAESILREAVSIEKLLTDVVQTIGLRNIGQRYYLHERFQRHLAPIMMQGRGLQHNMQPPLTQPQLVCVQSILEAGADLQHNLDNLWMYSRIQNGKIPVVRSEFDVEHLLLPIDLPDHEAIQLEMQIPEDFPYIRGDLERTQEAVRQVVDNAIHSTRQGRIRISAVTGNNLAKIRIEDSGRGIPPEQREAIFEPFFQINPEERGMGLGLWIAKALMDLQDGNLTMESSPGEGATFTLVLPTAQQG